MIEKHVREKISNFCLAIILIALAVLVILAVFYVFMPKIGGHENAHGITATADIYGGIKSALGQYEVDNGHYPNGTNGLSELVQKTADATNWHGPYLEKLPVDPWGNNYIYECPGRHNTNAYDLFSTGPDGRVGTEDDIVNWTK